MRDWRAPELRKKKKHQLPTWVDADENARIRRACAAEDIALSAALRNLLVKWSDVVLRMLGE